MEKLSGLILSIKYKTTKLLHTEYAVFSHKVSDAPRCRKECSFTMLVFPAGDSNVLFLG